MDCVTTFSSNVVAKFNTVPLNKSTLVTKHVLGLADACTYGVRSVAEVGCVDTKARVPAVTADAVYEECWFKHHAPDFSGLAVGGK